MKNWSGNLATAAVIGILLLAIAGSIVFARSHKEGPWIDTTDVVSEQSAASAGRQAADPFINTGQGNMLVFFFTLAGVLAGPVIGHYWRRLMVGKARETRKQLNRMFIIGIILAAVMLMIAGHEAFSVSPFINPDMGDVKLFAFILLGTITGFVAGYYWRGPSAREQGGNS